MSLISDTSKYKVTYRKRLLWMSMYLEPMIDHVFGILVNELNLPSLLDAKEKAFIIFMNEIMRLKNRKMTYEPLLFGIDGMIYYKTVGDCITIPSSY